MELKFKFQINLKIILFIRGSEQNKFKMKHKKNKNKATTTLSSSVFLFLGPLNNQMIETMLSTLILPVQKEFYVFYTLLISESDLIELNYNKSDSVLDRVVLDHFKTN